ncbi:hypothetical protein K501DRAFT_275661 [Backusella circina FSU 941]|nr:hypothetical protein K501DRAFT_275661 [Backusella circina FSU 941]
MTYFKIVFLSLLLLSFHIYCFEVNESTQAITQAINIKSEEPIISDMLTTSDVPIAFIKDVIDNVPFILSDEEKDDDDDKKGKKKHKKKKKHGKDDDNASNTINPTTTIYSTIYIIATEAPTQIYTGTNQPAKQKGQKSDGNEISDPNSSQYTGDDDNDNDNDDDNDDNDDNDNNNNNNNNDDDDDDDNNNDSSSQSSQNSDNNNQVNTQPQSGHSSSYKRLVAALSVIGSIAAIALFAAAFVFTRRRISKKKHYPNNYPKDLEMGPCSLLSPPPPPPHKHIPPPPPSLRHSSYRINVTQYHDGESTLIEFGNPFNNPIEEKYSDSIDLTPELPTSLSPESYIDYRQNHTLSLLSQTTAAEPSAPTEKELHENPFEQQNNIPLYYSMNQVYPTDHEEIIGDSNSIMENEENTTALRPQQQHQSQNQVIASDLPPAYTPSAIPSAPPLYALPTISHVTEMRRSPSINSSRRHSVSSSIVTEYRPLSLRRGSGSLAFISSPIS